MARAYVVPAKEKTQTERAEFQSYSNVARTAANEIELKIEIDRRDIGVKIERLRSLAARLREK